MKKMLYIILILFILNFPVPTHAQTYKQIINPDTCYLLIHNSVLSSHDEQIMEKMFKHYVKGIYKIFYSNDRQTLLMISDEIKIRYKTNVTVLCLKSELSDNEKEKYLSEILNKQYDYRVWLTKVENTINHIYNLIDNLNERYNVNNKLFKINKNLLKQDIDSVVEQIKTMYNINIVINTKNVNKSDTKTLKEWLMELQILCPNVLLIQDIIKELENIPN